MGFDRFAFHPTIASRLGALGFTAPTPIQEEAIPRVLEGRDLLGLAQTGTGKTAAFALPLLQRLMGRPKGRVRALVIAPTRELADQIHGDFQSLGRGSGVRSAAVYGGVGMGPQARCLQGGVEVVVACPGRLLDHMRQGTADLSAVEALVLDEADRLLDMGFWPSVQDILRRLPPARQTMLFSATMPEGVREMARRCLKDPHTASVGRGLPAETVAHALYPVRDDLKGELLLALLRGVGEGSALVFTRTKHRAKRLGLRLEKAGFAAASLQGNLSQNRRKAAMDGFRDGSYRVLVATDIAARGIDVSQVTHVFNYDVPDTPEAYTHRIGRTGRAARTGDAFTLVTGQDHDQIRAIERHMGRPIQRRTLAGFDYAARPQAPAPQPPPRPAPRAGRRRW